MSGTASRAKKRSNSNVLQHPTYILKDICQTKNKGLHYTTPGFLSKKAQKRQKTALFRQKNTGLLEAKHPYFYPKRSELCPKEVRCFCISGPKTPRKHAKRGLKAYRAYFAIFRTDNGRGGFRRPSRANNGAPMRPKKGA